MTTIEGFTFGQQTTKKEKTTNRHKGIEWVKVDAKLEAHAEKLWPLNEMEKTCGEPDVVGYDNLPARQERRTNIFFLTAQRKVLKTAEVFVTTAKRWNQGKNINRKITLLIWQPLLALNF